jgi:hypothetical protein
MWLALWCGSKRLPETSAGVAMAQRVFGNVSLIQDRILIEP